MSEWSITFDVYEHAGFICLAAIGVLVAVLKVAQYFYDLFMKWSGKVPEVSDMESIELAEGTFSWNRDEADVIAPEGYLDISSLRGGWWRVTRIHFTKDGSLGVVEHFARPEEKGL